MKIQVIKKGLKNSLESIKVNLEAKKIVLDLVKLLQLLNNYDLNIYI